MNKDGNCTATSFSQRAESLESNFILVEDVDQINATLPPEFSPVLLITEDVVDPQTKEVTGEKLFLQCSYE